MFIGVAATAASRVYLAVIALLVLPFYLRLLGEEAYGLVALFFVLQVWLQLLDFGLSATLSREAARHRAGALPRESLWQLLRSIEGVFLAAAVLAGTLLLLASPVMADRWLRLEHLSRAEARSAFELLALCVVARLFGDPYRGVLAGFERQGWLAVANTSFGTLRWLGVLPFLDWAGASVRAFFAFQLVVTALESLILRLVAHRLVSPPARPVARWSLHPLQGVAGFSLSMFLASVIWVLVSQVDKLVLSGMLTLGEFGAFSLAASAATGVLIATGSLTDTLIPRLSGLQAAGLFVELHTLYRRATQWAGLIALPLAALTASQPERVLWVWTGDTVLAAKTAPVLALYGMGNAALAISAFPFYLQLARGKLCLHILGTALMVASLVPVLVWSTDRYGTTGAAGAWFAVNLLYLLAWTPVVHARFAAGLHFRWLFQDVVPIAAAAAIAAWFTQLLPWPSDRAGTGLMLLGSGGAILIVCATASRWVRSQILDWYRYGSPRSRR